MNFFDMSTERDRIVTNSYIWIFFVLSFALSAATYLSFYRRLNRDDANGKVRHIRFRFATLWRKINRLSTKSIIPDIELQSAAP